MIDVGVERIARVFTKDDIKMLKESIKIGEKIRMDKAICTSEDGRLVIPGQTVVVAEKYRHLVRVELPGRRSGYRRPWTMTYIEIAMMRRNQNV